jgi:hypothetical protein
MGNKTCLLYQRFGSNHRAIYYQEEITKNKLERVCVCKCERQQFDSEDAMGERQTMGVCGGWLLESNEIL